MPKNDEKAHSHLDEIAAAAKIYGARSFDNYVQIRSVAESIRDGLCAWLDNQKQCVFLVPPQGPLINMIMVVMAATISGLIFNALTTKS